MNGIHKDNVTIDIEMFEKGNIAGSKVMNQHINMIIIKQYPASFNACFNFETVHYFKVPR